jgi:phenylpyruvate tautomerase PptA (4-oxalocrotonate tautomerase family)
MPYISVNLSFRVPEDKKEQIKSALGKAITLIPGKTENSLMVGICDGYDIYLAGVKKEKAAYVDVKILGKASRESKKEISVELFKIFEMLLDIKPEDMYITFSEHDEWGVKGSLK